MWLKIATEIGDKAGEGCVFGKLGNCYLSLRQYNKAAEHYEMRLKIVGEIGDKG